MKSSQENELVMEEITVKNLQEISGGSLSSTVKDLVLFPKPYILTGAIMPTNNLPKW